MSAGLAARAPAALGAARSPLPGASSPSRRSLSVLRSRPSISPAPKVAGGSARALRAHVRSPGAGRDSKPMTASASSTPAAAPAATDMPCAVVHLTVKTELTGGAVRYSAHGGAWEETPLLPTMSSGGRTSMCLNIMHALLPMPMAGGDPAAPAIAFSIVDKDGNPADPPQDGTESYAVESPGHFEVVAGAVAPQGHLAYLVVSDLDGTMVGDDEAMVAFKDYWENVAAGRGAVLCYSTGRSLEQFEALVEEKEGGLATPDVLISAVGTKVYEHSAAGWAEDPAWTATLDAGGWHCKEVTDIVAKGITLAGEEAAHMRPEGEQNSHKITIGLRVEKVAEVEEFLSKELATAGIAAKIIVSGCGDWRYMDIVSAGAGKRESLEYIRRRYGFGAGRTVACGDSGNDILMLEGDTLAIVVGNAQEDIRGWVEKRRQEARGKLLLTEAYGEPSPSHQHT